MVENMRKHKSYCYLIERKRDGERFCTFGNFKEAWNRPTALFQFVSDTFPHPHPSPFGLRSNISCDLKYDSKNYRVIFQVAQ